jgi:acyl carrier protein
MDDEIRQVLAAHGRLSVDAGGLAPEADLYSAGLTSHATVNVMLALEDAFDVEFPDAMLRKSTFGSVESLRTALQQLLSDTVSS